MAPRVYRQLQLTDHPSPQEVRQPILVRRPPPHPHPPLPPQRLRMAATAVTPAARVTTAARVAAAVAAATAEQAAFWSVTNRGRFQGIGLCSYRRNVHVIKGISSAAMQAVHERRTPQSRPRDPACRKSVSGDNVRRHGWHKACTGVLAPRRCDAEHRMG